MVSAGRCVPLPKGDWNNIITYYMLDIVTHNNIAWICKRECLGQEPTDGTYWQRFGSASPIATTSVAGIVIPDGTTIAVAQDGTISVVAKLGDLANVELTNLANGQVMAYNAATQTWVNVDISTTLAGLEDVDLTGVADGQIIAYNASTQKWEPIDPPSSQKSEILIDYDPAEMAGITVTLAHAASAEGHTPESYQVTLDNTGEVEQDVINLGLWTITWTHEGQSYSEEFNVHYYGYFHVMLHEGFTWRQWVVAGGLPINKYDSLAELLANQEDIRRLCTIHAAVDYMCEFASVNNDLETIINTGLFAKWANLSDYALDHMEANAVLSDLMDDADLYGYGELIEDNGSYVPKGNVPVMTSDTAPYGEAFANSSMTSLSRYPYKAFDGDPTTIWMVNTEATGYLGYKFTNPVCVKRVYFKKDTASPNRWQEYKIQASNDGTNWTDLTETLSTETNVGEYTISVDNNNYYLYYRAYCSKTSDNGQPALYTLQFYGRELKVSVPTMTSNTEPYGEVTKSSEYSSTYMAWKAFDKNASTYWSNAYLSGDTWQNTYIGYKFGQKIKLGMVVFKPFKDSSGLCLAGYAIKGSNDNGATWDILSTGSVSTDDEVYLNISSDEVYDEIRLVPTSQTTYSAGSDAIALKELQFYGKDYSECEWDADYPRHYLYDHGLELETINKSQGGITINPDDMLFTKSATYVPQVSTEKFDLSNYHYVVAKASTKMYKASSTGYFTMSINENAEIDSSNRVAIADVTGKDGYIDISAITQSKRACLFINSANGNYTQFNEWWLE